MSIKNEFELIHKLTKKELQKRIAQLYARMNEYAPWDAVVLVDKINHYYLTGTMQDGMFILRKDGAYNYFARRSYERAKEESPLSEIVEMHSYRDAAPFLEGFLEHIYLDTEVLPVAALERMKRHLAFTHVHAADPILKRLRSVKSSYELDMMMESGRQHAYLLDSIIPGLLREGMSETELMAETYCQMLKLGYHGISRFSMFQTEIIAGQFGFGENALYPTSFDGPGGMKGLCPAAPGIGDRKRLLKKGDLVFADIGYGVNGYHTDRTQIYLFGGAPAQIVIDAHRACLDIQGKAAQQLRPGASPNDIYTGITDTLDPVFSENFMGFGKRQVKFLGHGVGLHIDEYPVISAGFTDPLIENMTIALEPKKGISGFGVVGVEDTYIVTPQGGKCITGGEKEIMVV